LALAESPSAFEQPPQLLQSPSKLEVVVAVIVVVVLCFLYNK
jgi:hypothetical protein